VQLTRDVEALQEHGRVALRRVAVLFADDALELAEPHAFRVGERRLGVERLTRLQRLPQTLVAHDDGIDDAERVEGELVLPEHAELVRPRDRAFLRQGLAGQQLHERGLAGAIRSGEPVAAALENVVVTSSNSSFEPNRIETSCTEIINAL
jgi:hypothetical protein